MRTTASGGTTTTFLYSGDQLVAEYESSSLVDRYAFGAGADRPITWYEGSALTTRNWLHADELGSVIATSDNSGAATIYTYSPYGEPNTWSGSRFKYTGQIALPEVQLYHYKARVYGPPWGRFLQTDPVGYEGDNNLYLYVGNDPLNRSDPTGMLPPEGSIAEEQMFRGAHDTAAHCGEPCAVAGAVVGAALAAPIIVAGATELGTLALANPVTVTEAIAVAGEVAVPGATLAGGAGAVASSLDDMSRAAGAADRNGLTAAGRALQKHGDRAGSAFPQTTGGPRNLNPAGQGIVDDILTSPGATQTANRFGGVDVTAPDGRGVRYNANGEMMGLLEP